MNPPVHPSTVDGGSTSPRQTHQTAKLNPIEQESFNPSERNIMPKSSIAAVALVAFLAGALLPPAADAFVPQHIRAARSAAPCESVS